MYRANYKKHKASLCYKDVCFKVVGSAATVVAIGAASYLVGKGAANLMQSTEL